MSLLDQLLEPERRAKAIKDQQSLKEVFGARVNRDPIKAKYLFGIARQRLALDSLDSGHPADSRILEQLANGAFLQGQFDEAVELAPEGENKDLYTKYAKAVEHIGEQQCAHETEKQMTEQKIWNGATTITFTICIECRAISAYA